MSEICLGTMTWGYAEYRVRSPEQMDYALENGVNFFDTAALPDDAVSAETQGRTEDYIGTWFQKSGKRIEVVLANQGCGFWSRDYIRGGRDIDAAAIREAVDNHAHAPEDRLHRSLPDPLAEPLALTIFRGAWSFDASKQNKEKTLEEFNEKLETLSELVRPGKFAPSDFPTKVHGVRRNTIDIAEAKGLPRVASIQNEYNLLYRSFDLDLAEVAHHEDVGLLAYSPLAGGILTGKYQNGARPERSRGSINHDIGGRLQPLQEAPVKAYLELAYELGIDPAQLAIAFCLTRPFMASVIIGATTMEQLKTDIAAARSPVR